MQKIARRLSSTAANPRRVVGRRLPKITKGMSITNHSAGHSIHAELSRSHKFERGYSFSSSVTSLLN